MGARRKSSQKARPRSWILTLLSTGLLVAFGFSFGLLVGATWEEPELVLGYFRGDAEDVPLEALAEVEDVAMAVPPRPEPERPRPAATRDEPAPRETTARTPEVAAPPPPAAEAGPFSIQVGSFTEPIPALRLAESLGDKQYTVYVAEGDAAGKPRWRVRVGPVETRGEAERLARRLKSNERLPTWVLQEEGR